MKNGYAWLSLLLGGVAAVSIAANVAMYNSIHFAEDVKESVSQTVDATKSVAKEKVGQLSVVTHNAVEATKATAVSACGKFEFTRKFCGEETAPEPSVDAPAQVDAVKDNVQNGTAAK